MLKESNSEYFPPLPAQATEAECRICCDYASEEEGLLKNACGCKGSVATVHESCLIKWLKMKGIRRCEVCHTPYNFQE
jgi:E3 ubiquitin-protein ligase DOA10